MSTGRAAGADWHNAVKYRQADFTVAVSHALAAELSAGDAALKVQCIPNGVDLARVRRLAAEPFDHPLLENAGLEMGRPVLATMGRISHQKGFDILLRALAMLPGALDARLLVIGDGSAAERRRLADLAAELGVASRIAWLGYRDNPFSIISRADMFVSASRWEGSSNALMEALACGLPLVATDCPTGNREVLMDGRCGTLAPVEDPAALAQAIVTELALRRPRADQIEAAHAFDIGKCLDDWVGLLSAQMGVVRPSSAAPVRNREAA